MWMVAVALIVAFNGGSEIERGVTLYRSHDYAQAVAVLEAALGAGGTAGPQASEGILTLGQSYFMLSQAPKAIPWLERAAPSNESAYMLGYAYLQVNRPAKAREAFARLFALRADSAGAHLLTAQMMLKKDYDDAAGKELEAALALDPKLPEVHFLLAEVAIFRGRVDEGIAHLRQELAINPNLAKAWYRLGEALSRQEQWDDAIPQLQRAIWLNPEYSGPYIVLGKCYFKKSDWVNAEGILRRAVALDPGNRQGNFYLGQTLIQLGKKDEAKPFLDRVRGGSTPQ